MKAYEHQDIAPASCFPTYENYDEYDRGWSPLPLPTGLYEEGLYDEPQRLPTGLYEEGLYDNYPHCIPPEAADTGGNSLLEYGATALDTALAWLGFED